MGKAGAPLKSALKDGGSKTGAKKAAGAAEDPSTGAMMEFRELFDLIDVDRSGEISKEELGNLMKILRIQVGFVKVVVCGSRVYLQERTAGVVVGDLFTN